MENIIDILEHKEIFDIVKDRKEVAKSDYISMEDMAKKEIDSKKKAKLDLLMSFVGMVNNETK